MGVQKINLFTNANLDILRRKGDPVADDAVVYLAANPSWAEAINEWDVIPSPLPIELPKPLFTYFSLFRLPDYTSQQARISLAQTFFAKHALPYLSLLGFYALPYTYAFADGAQVLVRSKRMLSEPGKRLDETLLFVLDCFRPGTLLKPNASLLTLAKVRLIHAFSRFFIRKYSPYWNPAWGEPINQEDLIGTNLAFSLIVLRGLKRISVTFTSEEAEAVLAYWGFLGDFLGVDRGYWPENPKDAFWLEKIIRTRHARQSEAGLKLIGALKAFFSKEGQMLNAPKQIESLMSFFLGPELSDVLALNQANDLPQPIVQLLLKGGILSAPAIKSYADLEAYFKKEMKNKYGVSMKLSIPVMS